LFQDHLYLRDTLCIFKFKAFVKLAIAISLIIDNDQPGK